MKYGLNDTTIEAIQKVFETNSKIDEVIVFGSRAKGNYKEGSDIDLAIKGRNINLDDILSLSRKLDELNLPYTMDLINYATINDKNVVEHIDRVGIEFYKRWRKVKLGKYINVVNGYAFKSSNFINDIKDDPLPVIKIKNVANGDVHLNDVQYHSYDSSLKKYVIEKGDILIALTGNHPEVMTQVVGEVSLYKLNGKALLNQRVAKIEAKEGLDKNYLYYFLKDDATHDIIATNSGGSANQANISKTDLENLEILLPPCNEQKSISSILMSLDDKIDLLHRQNKTLEQLAETLFRQWFVEEVDESWEVGNLKDVLELVYGKALKEELRTGTGFPVVGSSGVVGHHSEYLVEGPGIVIGRKGTLGKVIYIFENFFPIDTTYFVKSKINSIGLFYEYFLLKTLNFEEMNSDSAVPGLNRDIALSTEIKVAPKDRLKEFNSQCFTLFKKIESNTNQIKKLTQLRDTLLPKLMSGEIQIEI